MSVLSDFNSSQSKERRDSIKQLEKELDTLEKALEKALEKEKKELETLFQKRTTLAKIKKLTFETALKVSKIQPKNYPVKQKKELASYLLLTHYAAPVIESHVRKQAEKLGVKTVIDAALIDTVILEEKTNIEKALEATKTGKTKFKIETGLLK
ncbi:MAG: hypothetical protein JWO53_1381 [Chlamydiia bacterium]|nr:hypothetical protein [Chlamydiia bacterium]